MEQQDAAKKNPFQSKENKRRSKSNATETRVTETKREACKKREKVWNWTERKSKEGGGGKKKSHLKHDNDLKRVVGSCLAQKMNQIDQMRADHEGERISRVGAGAQDDVRREDVDLLQRSQENEKAVMALSGEEEEEREGQTRKTASV